MLRWTCDKTKKNKLLNDYMHEDIGVTLVQDKVIVGEVLHVDDDEDFNKRKYSNNCGCRKKG